VAFIQVQLFPCFNLVSSFRAEYDGDKRPIKKIERFRTLAITQPPLLSGETIRTQLFGIHCPTEIALCFL
jgi:hypothetical protein